MENTVALESLQKIDEQKRKELEIYIKNQEEIEKGLTDTSSIVYRLATEPSKNVIQYLAQCYVATFEAGLSKVPINEIANHLVDKLEGYVAKTTIYDALGSKFKSHTPNPNTDEELDLVRNRTENSSLNTEVSEQRKKLSSEITRAANLAKEYARDFLDPKIIIPTDEEEKFPERIKNFDSINAVLEKLRDGRQSVPSELEYHLVTSFIQETNNYVGGLYIEKVRKFGADHKKDGEDKLETLSETVTSKQSVKIILGHVKKSHPLFDPQTRNQALECGFHGTQCPKCDSWRTDLDFDANVLQCKCFACDAKFDRGVVSKCRNCYSLFFDEQIYLMILEAKEISESSIRTNCVHCNIEVFLQIGHLTRIKQTGKIQRIINKISSGIANREIVSFNVEQTSADTIQYLLVAKARK